jgi:hypothetical protein
MMGVEIANDGFAPGERSAPIPLELAKLELPVVQISNQSLIDSCGGKHVLNKLEVKPLGRSGLRSVYITSEVGCMWTELDPIRGTTRG